MLNAWFVWSTGTRLERRLVELRQAGEPVQLADLAHPPIPPEKNADVFLRRAADDLDAIQKELLALYPKVGYPGATVSPAEGEKLEKVFAAYPKVMPLLEQAADSPDSDLQLDCTLPPSRFLEPLMARTQNHRLIARVLRARSAMLLSKGRADDALATQILALRLTRRWHREPSLIAYLVRLACVQTAIDSANLVLQTGPVSASARQALDHELALHDTIEGYNWAIGSERAFSLSTMNEIPLSGFWLTRGFTNDVMSRLIDLYDGYLKKSSQPYPDIVASKGASPPPSGGMNPYGPLVTLLVPALDAIRPPTERTRAMSRCLRVLNAIQARVPPGTDRVPGLGDLGLPPEATIDPFNGEALQVKHLPEGWMIYSIGMNLVDDGGIPDGKSDIGVGPIRPEDAPKKPLMGRGPGGEETSRSGARFVP
jgi:hypothetical protein